MVSMMVLSGVGVAHAVRMEVGVCAPVPELNIAAN
jgi:hypothetical protein